jgi:UDP-N-acetylmuramate dehydrogenase
VCFPGTSKAHGFTGRGAFTKLPLSNTLADMQDPSELRAMAEAVAAETGFTGEIRCGEPLSAHTTFKVGGPADLWVRPRSDCFPRFAAALLGAARSRGVPLFILGGGANLVVSDQGIRGIVLDTTGWTGWTGDCAGGTVTVRSGTAVEAAAEQGWGGLEFLAGMPAPSGGGFPKQAFWKASCPGPRSPGALLKRLARFRALLCRLG